MFFFYVTTFSVRVNSVYNLNNGTVLLIILRNKAENSGVLKCGEYYCLSV
jgi:hypothetical protein